MNELIDTFANRLKCAIRRKNIKPIELSKKTGISKTNISCYMSGKYEAKQDGIKLLSDALKVDPVWLMGYDVPMEKKEVEIVGTKTKQYYMCPVYAQISARQPNWAEENIEGRIPIDINLMNIVNPEEYFFLRVNGESMNKVVKNGAFALIHKQDTVENGEIAVVLVNSFDATINKFTKQENLIILEPQSEDTSFKLQVYDKNNSIKILGKYVGKMEISK